MTSKEMAKTQDEINIYPSISKSLIILIISLVFVALGSWSLYEAKNPRQILGGICAIFFLLATLISLHAIALRCLHKPVLRIYKDRVESRYYFRHWAVYPFEEIEIFTITKVSGVKIISVHFLDNRIRHLSGFISDQIDICDLLNERLEEYDQTDENFT